jgi:hypothetical protein
LPNNFELDLNRPCYIVQEMHDDFKSRDLAPNNTTQRAWILSKYKKIEKSPEWGDNFEIASLMYLMRILQNDAKLVLDPFVNCQKR